MVFFFSDMSGGLKADLDSYLSKSSSSPLAFKNLSIPSFKNVFGSKDAKSVADDEEALLSDSESTSASSWYSEAKKDCFPSLSKKQRIFGFITSLGLGLFFFSMATLYIPVLILKARKFSLLFSLGSLIIMGSFSFLFGPCNHFSNLFGKERLPFTVVYLISLFSTLYFALALQSTIFTTASAVCQVIALGYFVISGIPGGQAGIKFFSRICSSMCKRGSGSILPI